MRWLFLAVALIAVAFAAIVLLDDVTSDPETLAADPNPDSPYRMFALGDSYISGEGADNYLPGTDETGEPGRNLCHRAATAYPHLAARSLGVSLTFVACSGAKTEDVTGVSAGGEEVGGQYPDAPSDVFGARPQVDVLAEAAAGDEERRPDLVLIGIGGNDAGFAKLGVACGSPVGNCGSPKSADRWLGGLDAVVHPALTRTYARVREAAGNGVPVFAFTYPNPFGPEFCDDLFGVIEPEMTFIRDRFLPQLNRTVESAARAAGVRVIDLSHALDGHRFCDGPLSAAAINFVKLGRTRGAQIDPRSLHRGSLHPSPLGHRLIEAEVMAELRAARRAAGAG